MVARQDGGFQGGSTMTWAAAFLWSVIAVCVTVAIAVTQDYRIKQRQLENERARDERG